jgi:hypothetical protein
MIAELISCAGVSPSKIETARRAMVHWESFGAGDPKTTVTRL